MTLNRIGESMNTMNMATVSGRNETNAFAHIHIGAKHMLEQAIKSEEGQLYNFISCLVFSAFTLEAYFNHFGKLGNAEWDTIERGLSKLKKYKTFCKQHKIQYDFEKRPYSTIKELFTYRDSMAHGKSTVEDITKKVQIDPEHPNRFFVGSGWMEYATLENSKKAIEDVELIVCELHSSGGYEGNPFEDLGRGVYAVSI